MTIQPIQNLETLGSIRTKLNQLITAVNAGGGGGGGGPAIWGSITGDLEDQTDLWGELGNKADTADLSSVALTGQFSSLLSIPSTFPPSAHTQTASTITDFTSAVIAVSPVQSVAGKNGVVTLVKGDVDLGNVDNTSDLDKPISTATQTALDLKANSESLAAVALSGDFDNLLGIPTTLSGYGITDVYTQAQVDFLIGDFETSSELNTRDTANRNRANHTGTQSSSTISDFASQAAAAAPVQSVAGKNGIVVLVKGDVGLGNVDNTSDLDKPISNDTQTALDLKANIASVPFGFKYDQQSVPGSPSTGEIWVERTDTGTIGGIWEWTENRWVSITEQTERSLRSLGSANFTDIFSSAIWSGPDRKEFFLSYYYVESIVSDLFDVDNKYSLEFRGSRLTPSGSLADITPRLDLGHILENTVTVVTTPTIMTSTQPGFFNRLAISGTRIGNPGSIAVTSIIKFREIRP